MFSATFLCSSSHPFRSLTFCPSFKTRANKMVLMIHSHEYLLSAVCGVEVLHRPSIPGSSHLCSGSFIRAERSPRYSSGSFIWSKWFPGNSFGSGFRKESFPTKLFQFFWCCIFYIFHIQDLNHSFYSSLIITGSTIAFMSLSSASTTAGILGPEKFIAIFSQVNAFSVSRTSFESKPIFNGSGSGS